MILMRALCATFIVVTAIHIVGVSANFSTDFTVYWGQEKAYIFNYGNSLRLWLDQSTGTALRTFKQYMFGSIQMYVKVIPGNSSGTVAAFYLHSGTDKHDEVDFEFLGNVSGQPYILHTNLFINGVGNREKQYYMWFDPTANYHNYTIHWNPSQIVWFVDNIPVRVFRNYQNESLPYPNQQGMNVYSSLWNGEDWATQGGRVKIDWSYAPFIANITNYNSRACVWQGPNSTQPCSARSSQNWWTDPSFQTLNETQLEKFNWVRTNYLVHSYCKDPWNGYIPPECSKDPYV